MRHEVLEVAGVGALRVDGEAVVAVTMRMPRLRISWCVRQVAS
jgi:hypothetical protein